MFAYVFDISQLLVGKQQVNASYTVSISATSVRFWKTNNYLTTYNLHLPNILNMHLYTIKSQISQVNLNETGKELILNAEHHSQHEDSGKKKTLGFLEYKVLKTENYLRNAIN